MEFKQKRSDDFLRYFEVLCFNVAEPGYTALTNKWVLTLCIKRPIYIPEYEV